MLQPRSGHRSALVVLSLVALTGCKPDPPPVDSCAPGTYAIGGACLPGPTLTVDAVTSSTVSLSWSATPAATAHRVYLSYAPALERAGALPDQRLVATLAGSATSFTIIDLAAAVDVFVRVEVTTPTATLGASGHARTQGGRRAPLDSPLKEIHLAAPDLLLLVLHDDAVHSYSSDTRCEVAGCDAEIKEVTNDNGPAWQAGPWTVTRNAGSAIAVTAIHRNSIPANQSMNDWWHDHLVDVDHYLYLKLGQPIGNQEILTIDGPRGLHVILPYSDQYLETPVIQVNQVAYSPRATRRYAYVSGWLGDGGPLALDNFPTTAEVLREASDTLTRRSAALSGLAVAARASADDDAGTAVREIDLSALGADDGAIYRVRLPGIGVSWPTRVSEQELFKAFYVTARGLYHNRWGRDLQPQWTDWSPRPPDHPTIYTSEVNVWEQNETFTPPGPALTGARPLSGGHHDAGDCDIRIFHWLTAMNLMRLYQLDPAAFSDGQLTIPESGNGIPDLLDEALYSVRAWEQLQESDGGVRAGANSTGYCPGYTDEDTAPYWAYARDLEHTIRVAALFATAARLVAPFDAARSATLEARALSAYAYADARGSAEDKSCGAWLWMAGELWALTGDPVFKELYEATWTSATLAYDASAGPYLYQGLPWTIDPTDPGSLIAIGEFALTYALDPGADPTYVGQATATLTVQADEIVARLDAAHAHRNPRPPNQGPDWGYGTTLAYSMLPILWRLQLGGQTPAEAQRAFDALSLAADYELGCNPLGMVWVTGLGTRSPTDVLHVDSLEFTYAGGKEPIAGIPAYGPVVDRLGWPYYDFGDHVFYPGFSAHPLMRRYADLHTFVSTNEFDIVVQVLHTQLYGSLIAPGLMPSREWLPAAAQ